MNLFKTFVLFGTLTLLAACDEHQAISGKNLGNGVNVELLFENDGCKVYRFKDSSYHYYVDCRGGTISRIKTGKTSRPEEIPTGGDHA